MRTLSDLAKQRYTTKAFAKGKQIPEELIRELLVLLRFSPSSVNAQPWHFIFASSTTGKELILKSVDPGHTYNSAKIRDASHVIVVCSRTSLPERHLESILSQEEKDGRFKTEEAKRSQHTSRLSYVNLHKQIKDEAYWLKNQTYLSLGMLLLAAPILGLDATPMEGFDSSVLDETLDLRAKGLTSAALVSLGYRSETDFNATLPKSRLSEDKIFSFI